MSALEITFGPNTSVPVEASGTMDGEPFDLYARWGGVRVEWRDNVYSFSHDCGEPWCDHRFCAGYLTPIEAYAYLFKVENWAEASK